MRQPVNDITRRSVLKGAGAAGLGTLALSVLAACGGTATKALTSGAVKLKLWTHDPGYVATFQAAITDKAIIGKLPYKYSLSVVKSAGADILSRTISQASAGGDTPDLLGIIIDQFPRVMKNGIASKLFVDLTDLTAKFGDKLAKTAPYTVGGKLYALESDLSITVQYYRSDVFTKNKISTDIATWDDWIAAGAELNAKTGQYLGMHANGDNGSIFNGFLQFLLQRGGSPFDATGKFTLESQESLEVLKFMRDGIKSKAFVALSDPYGSACAAALKNSQLVATAMPNWYNLYGLQTNAPNQKGLWKIRTLPTFGGKGHIATTLGGTAFAVGLDKPNTAAATDLLRQTYLTREGQLLRYQKGGYLPTLIDLYKDEEFLKLEDKYLGGQHAFEIYAKAAKDIPVFYQNEGMTILAAVVGAPVLGVLKGTIEPAAALDQIVKTYNKQANK